jgi:hypothetical protein
VVFISRPPRESEKWNSVRAAIVAQDKSDVYGNNVAAHCRFLSFAVDLHLAQFMISLIVRGNALSTACSVVEWIFIRWYGARVL